MKESTPVFLFLPITWLPTKRIIEKWCGRKRDPFTFPPHPAEKMGGGDILGGGGGKKKSAGSNTQTCKAGSLTNNR